MSILFEAWRRARGGSDHHAETLGAPPAGYGRRPALLPWLLAFALAAIAAGLGVYLWQAERGHGARRAATVLVRVAPVPTRARAPLRPAVAASAAGRAVAAKAPATSPARVRTQAAATRPRAAPVVAAAATTPAPGASTAVPDAVRAALPPIVVMIHVWNPDPARRFIVVGGRTVRVGASIAPGVTLVEITRTGEVVRFRGYRLSLSAD